MTEVTMRKRPVKRMKTRFLRTEESYFEPINIQKKFVYIEAVCCSSFRNFMRVTFTINFLHYVHLKNQNELFHGLKKFVEVNYLYKFRNKFPVRNVLTKKNNSYIVDMYDYYDLDAIGDQGQEARGATETPKPGEEGIRGVSQSTESNLL